MNFPDMTEDELKRVLVGSLERDFLIEPEVMGIHIVENQPVVADFLLRPRRHIMDMGFDDIQFVVEVKSPIGKSPNGQYRKAVAQAASYVNSSFNGVRPAFALIFPNRTNFDEGGRKAEAVTAYYHLAQYLNVGDLFIETQAHSWKIVFAGGYYFTSLRGKGPLNLIGRYWGNVSN